MVKKRKIPLRICIGCQEKKPKKELVRVVRTPEAEVVLDLTGKKAGRGAYICPCEECLKKAVKGRRLEKNLEQYISDELIAEITAALQKAPEDNL
ncbi:MAG: RNase P modulator RnpM [Dethiobacteria bacterium]|nr:YlxR family protein [Bacillota bacterium]